MPRTQNNQLFEFFFFEKKRAAKDVKKAKATTKKPAAAASGAAKKAHAKAQVPKVSNAPKGAKPKVGGLR